MTNIAHVSMAGGPDYSRMLVKINGEPIDVYAVEIVCRADEFCQVTLSFVATVDVEIDGDVTEEEGEVITFQPDRPADPEYRP